MSVILYAKRKDQLENRAQFANVTQLQEKLVNLTVLASGFVTASCLKRFSRKRFEETEFL